MEHLKRSLLFLVVIPAACSVVPAMIWLLSRSHTEKVALSAMMFSLAATGRVALRFLDRWGINGMWPRLWWAIFAAAVGTIAWGLILHMGGGLEAG
jgi:hypothetical protein